MAISTVCMARRKIAFLAQTNGDSIERMMNKSTCHKFCAFGHLIILECYFSNVMSGLSSDLVTSSDSCSASATSSTVTSSFSSCFSNV